MGQGQWEGSGGLLLGSAITGVGSPGLQGADPSWDLRAAKAQARLGEVQDCTPAPSTVHTFVQVNDPTSWFTEIEVWRERASLPGPLGQEEPHFDVHSVWGAGG